MNTKLCIRNWDKWQSYRKDRGTPPWIKVHRVLFSNPKWAVLTDAEKGQLISLWIAAADNGGSIPDNPIVLRKICMLDNAPDINKFISLGFIESPCQEVDNHVTTTCQPDDAPETETETETETEKSIVGQKPRRHIPFKEIIGYFNETTGKGFKHTSKATQAHIRARFNEGFSLSDFKDVIHAKFNQWRGDVEMEQFIRPQTLFGPKFESYLQAAKETAQPENTWVKNELFSSPDVPH